MQQPPAAAEPVARWAKVIDQTRCIGCHACTTACKSENEVPLGVTRTYVKYADVGTFPHARRAFQVTRCNQCDDAPCTVACPTSAMYRRPDGIVDFDKSACIGCKACIAACPYDAIFINPEDHAAEKCNFCAHRLDIGLEPACVTVCPTEAILVGDLEDPDSAVGRMVGRDPLTVRRPEKETRPKLFYKGAHQATLDPLAAARPDGGLFMWSEQPAGPHEIGSGHPHSNGRRGANSSAAAVLSYDVSHKAPWDWRVSLYTLTKAVGAGVYLVLAGLGLTGWLPWDGGAWMRLAPFAGLAAMAVTGALLVWDLERPSQFHKIFTRPQKSSWLVRGAFIIAGYCGVLSLHAIWGLVGHAGAATVARWLAVVGAPLAVMTAVYTAYLFAQAKARDLWQSSLLPAHMLLQALVAGAAFLGLWAWSGAPGAGDLEAAADPTGPLGWMLGLGLGAHLLMTAGELTLTHATAHAALAAREMTRGRFAGWFWAGIGLAAAAAVGGLAATTGLWSSPPEWVSAAAGAAALTALFAHEHAYVQAGQSVPLA